MKKSIIFILVSITILISNKLFAQAPAISYSPTINTYTVGTAIPTLSPTNTGGAIAATVYGTVSTLAGNAGFNGHNDATGLAATFDSPECTAVDASGNVYVVDLNNNCIRKITSAGVVTTFAGSLTGLPGSADGVGTAASFSQPNGILIDATSTNLYVADYGGNTVRKIVIATATVSTFSTGLNGPAGMCFDAAGTNIYLAEQSGNDIVKIAVATGVFTTYAGTGVAGSTGTTVANATFNNPVDVSFNGTNLYVMDYGNNLIRKIIVSSGAVSTLAGQTTAGYTNATGTAAKFNGPYGMALDGAGNIYIGDSNNNNIRKVTSAGVVTLFAGSGALTAGSTDSTLTAALFSSPLDLTITTAGTMYVADNANNTIRQIAMAGYAISPALPAGLSFNGATGTISGTPTVAAATTAYTITGYNYYGSSSTTINLTINPPLPAISYTPTPVSWKVGTAIGSGTNTAPVLSNTGGAVTATAYSTVTTLAGTATNVNNPRGMVADGKGNIYEADFGGNAIYIVNSAGTATLIAGSTSGEVDNATGTSAKFNGPTGITFDGTAYLYVIDNGGKTIRKVSTTAPYAVTTIATSVGTAPFGVAYDKPNNCLYVTDLTGNKIYKVTTAGALSTIVTTGLNGPAGIAYDGSANLYIANQAGNNILKVAATGGTPTAFAGSGTAGSTNGTGTGASFKTPYGVAFDASGNLIVADQGNSLIRIITPTADVTTLAGVAGSAGETNGVGTAAKFTIPYSVCTDNIGNAYVGDNNAANSTIRKITLSGFTVTPALPAGVTLNSATGAITGNPSASTPAADYTITGYNASGSSSTVINITCYVQYTWKGTTSTTWATASNWVGNNVPVTAGDKVLIGSGTAQTNTFLPVIPSGSIINIGSITMGTLGSAAASITVNGTGVLNVSGDITYQSDNKSLTNTGYATTLAGTGTINVTNINVIASTNLANYTENLTSSVSNLNVSGHLSLTSTYNGATKIEDAKFSLTGGTMTLDSLNTSNANAANTSTFLINNTVSNPTLNITGSTTLAGLSATGNNVVNFDGTGVTVGYTGVAAQTVYTDVVTGLPLGVSYTNLNLSGSGIKTAATGNLNIAGNFTNTLANDVSNYADLSATTVQFNGTTQTLAGGSGNGTTLYTTNVSGGGTKTIGSGKFSLANSGVLTLSGSSTLATGGLLTLNSAATSSATIASIPSGSSITGNVNVQRFITGGNSSYRGYRLLSSPVHSGATSYYDLAYLKGTASGSYTTGAASGGFDATGNPTIYLYRQDAVPSNASFNAGNYRAITAINNSPNPYLLGTIDGTFNMPVGNGFLFFYRGNMGTNPSTVPASLTFSATGTLNQGQVIVQPWFYNVSNTSFSAANTLSYSLTSGTPTVEGFNLVGNPYPSAIDWNTIYSNNTTTSGICCSTNLDNSVYIYNTTTKNYSVWTSTSPSTGIASGSPGGSNILPQGQGFFVHAIATGAQLIFNESAKISSQPTTLLLNSATAPIDRYLRIQLSKDPIDKDETVIVFNKSVSTAYTQQQDALYLKGTGAVSLSSLSSDKKSLALYQLPFPQNIQAIPLNISVTASGTYQLNMTEATNIPNLFDVWLMDKYKSDSLDMKHNPIYDFIVNKSDTASYGANRFKLVIRLNNALAVHLLSFTGVKNIADVKLTWTAENEGNYTTYVLQRSIDGGHTFSVLDSLTSAAFGTYNDIDPHPITGINQYRLKQVDILGNVSYSNIISISYTAPTPTPVNNNVSVYPNPVRYILGVVIKPVNNSHKNNSNSDNNNGDNNNDNRNNNNDNNKNKNNDNRNNNNNDNDNKPATYKITITNNTGIILKTGSTNQLVWSTDVSRLLPGTYFVNVTDIKNNTLVGRTTFIKL